MAFTVNVGAVLSIVKTYVVDNLFSLLVTINEYSPSSDKIVPEINSSSFKIQEYFSSSKYGIILKLIYWSNSIVISSPSSFLNITVG